MALRMLGVLLCYNDGDILPDTLEALLNDDHDVIAWDHGSTDATADVLARYRSHLLETRWLPRTVNFHGLYQDMSMHLMQEYVDKYDWISWPDDDEILEGPDRTRNYRKWIEIVEQLGFDWVQFINFNFWFTAADDTNEPRVVQRVRHYAPFLHCAPRRRSWRASSTNVRHHNHNRPNGQAWPQLFNLRHYPARTAEQLHRRIVKDRVNIARRNTNFQYLAMAKRPELLSIAPSQLYYDDGKANLNASQRFNWGELYGWPSPASSI